MKYALVNYKTTGMECPREKHELPNKVYVPKHRRIQRYIARKLRYFVCNLEWFDVAYLMITTKKLYINYNTSNNSQLFYFLWVHYWIGVVALQDQSNENVKYKKCLILLIRSIFYPLCIQSFVQPQTFESTYPTRGQF